jgi:hypothetical protein
MSFLLQEQYLAFDKKLTITGEIYPFGSQEVWQPHPSPKVCMNQYIEDLLDEDDAQSEKVGKALLSKKRQRSRES